MTEQVAAKRTWDFHQDTMGFKLRQNGVFALVKPQEGDAGKRPVEYGYISEVELDENDTSSIKISFVSNKTCVKHIDSFNGWDTLKLDRSSADASDVVKRLNELIQEDLEISGDKMEDANESSKAKPTGKEVVKPKKRKFSNLEGKDKKQKVANSVRPPKEGNNLCALDKRLEGKIIDRAVVHITSLLEPPKQYQLREVDNKFVSEIKSSPGITMGYNKTVFPVVVAGTSQFVQSRVKDFKFYTLGGNHLRTSLQALHEQGNLSPEKQLVNILIYRDLSSVEALRVAANHNADTHKVKKSTFRDEVLRMRQLFYESLQLDTEKDEPPKKMYGELKAWKETCGKTILYQQDVSLRNLKKYTTHFAIARLSRRAFAMAEEVWERKPGMGQTNFKFLVGLNEEDLLEVLNKLKTGALMKSKDVQAECDRRKAMVKIKMVVKECLEENSWDQVRAKFPEETSDEALFPFTSCDFSCSPELLVDYVNAFQNRRAQQDEGTQNLSLAQTFPAGNKTIGVIKDVNDAILLKNYTGAALFVLEDMDNTFTKMMEKARTLKGARPSLIMVIKTTFKLVSYLIGNLESNAVPYKTTVLMEDDDVRPVVVTLIGTGKDRLWTIIQPGPFNEMITMLISNTTESDDWVVSEDEADSALVASSVQRNAIILTNDENNGHITDEVVEYLNVKTININQHPSVGEKKSEEMIEVPITTDNEVKGDSESDAD